MHQSRFTTISTRILDYVIGILLVIIFCLTVTNVFCRYFLGWSFGWADELSRFLFIWIGFLGTALAFSRNEHVALKMFTNKLPPRFSRITDTLAILVCIGLLAGFLWQGSVIVYHTVNRSPAIGIPMRIVYSCVPISAALGIIYGIERLFARNIVNS